MVDGKALPGSSGRRLSLDRYRKEFPDKDFLPVAEKYYIQGSEVVSCSSGFSPLHGCLPPASLPVAAAVALPEARRRRHPAAPCRNRQDRRLRRLPRRCQHQNQSRFPFSSRRLRQLWSPSRRNQRQRRLRCRNRFQFRNQRRFLYPLRRRPRPRNQAPHPFRYRSRSRHHYPFRYLRLLPFRRPTRSACSNRPASARP